MSRSKIALCVIAKNKQHIIERMLDSTKGVFDLYCLEDTGSTDDTMKVFEEWCKKNNKEYKMDRNIYQTVEINGIRHLAEFSKARNSSFTLARSCKYAMWLDTDDVLINPEQIPQVVEMMDKDNYDIVVMRYNYAQDGMGNNLAEQRRERIINITQGGKWVGVVHENYDFPSELKIKVLNLDGIEVKHLRTPTEAMETGRRNNKILKLREEKIGFDGLSDKELWDLGFDHWEYSEMDQAERYFTKLLKHEKNLIKERRLDLKMKLAKIYFSEKKLEKTTELIYNILLKEDPKYSPAYLLLGEILASIRDWEGLEYISRKVESIGKPQGTGVVNDVEYKVIPKRMMLTSLVARGRYEEALKVLQDIMQIIPDNPQLMAEYHNITHEKDRVEFVGAYARINKYLEKTNEIDKSPHLLELIPKDMKDDNLINQLKGEITFDIARKKKVKLKGEKTIEFYCGGHLEKWDGNSDIKKGIGGSEGMVIIMARELAKLGNKVTVYNESDGKVIDGVHYENWQKWKPENKCDVYIGLRSAGLESMKTFIEAKKQYLYLHDTYYGNYPQLNFNMFNKVLVLSNYHKQVIKEQHGIKDDTIFHVTRNSFNDKAIPKKMPVRNKNKFIYASSYDRGLDSLLMSWARIKEALPYAELHIYYGWDTYDALAQARGSKQMIEYKDNVLRLLKQKDVFEHGRVTQKELYKAFAESNAWLYPTTFTEVSCITAMQSQLLGAIPITTPSGALPETVNKKYGVIVDQKNFVDAVVQTVGNYSEDKRNKMMEWANETYNPVGLAKDWDNLFNSLN